MIFAFALLLPLILALCIAKPVRALARRYNVLDIPGGRHKHERPTPLWGGIVIYVASVVGVLVLGIYFPQVLLSRGVTFPKLIGLLVGASIITLGGLLDDKYKLSAFAQFVFSIIAAMVVVISGVHLRYLTNPFGGLLWLNAYTVQGPWGISIAPIADGFTILWLMVVMYTTKLLDGLEGLVSGLTVIGALIITFLVLFQSPIAEPAIALLALVVAGSFLGFLPSNWSPAQLFLGEAGALLAGFWLGSLGVLSEGKIATSLLILGVPALDVVAVILQRALGGQPLWSGDRRHLHFRLRDVFGLSGKQTVYIYWTLALLFGAIGVFLKSYGRLIALGVLFVAATILIGAALMRERAKQS